MATSGNLAWPMQRERQRSSDNLEPRKRSIMKRQDSNSSGIFSNGMRAALVGMAIAITPLPVFARGGGGFSGGGFSHMGGGGFSHSGGDFSRNLGSGESARNTFGEAGRNDGSFLTNQNTFARTASGIGELAHAPNAARQSVHNFRVNEPSHARINHEFDQLARFGDRSGDFRFRRDRLFRTRDFLIGLVDFGWPVDLVDTWSDAVAQDEILVGMPSDLVLDYWGNPLAINAIALAGEPAQIWTYRSLPGGTVKVTVMGNKVTAIHRV